MKDQRPLRYRNSLVGGKYTKKKYTPWDFSFSYSSLVMEEPAPVQQDCEVRVLGAPCQIRTGEVCLNPPVSTNEPKKKKSPSPWQYKQPKQLCGMGWCDAQKPINQGRLGYARTHERLQAKSPRRYY
jgi:hypothetical protein